MGKHVSFSAKRNGNIIPIHMDAAFFYERAVKSLDKYDYQKAIRYFRKAIELEPNNPVHYCNLAGTLSEVGRFEESNRYLYQVIETIDPDMTECYFYLANNFINMDQILDAEKYVVDYLELDRLGEFREDAEEMLEYISHELGRPPQYRESNENKADQTHEKAKRLMEQGCFIQASEMLKRLLEQHPEYTAARNNLALSHYYMGELEEGLEIVRAVLEQEPNNIHALCNQAIFYSHLNLPDELTEVLNILAKVVPMQFEEVYKLATTLGILGRHESAYFLFRKLAKYTMYSDPVVLHYAAISAYNLDKQKEAKQWWEKAKNSFPQSVVFDWFIERTSQKKPIGIDERQDEEKPAKESAPSGNNSGVRPFPYYFRWDIEQDPAGAPENNVFSQAIRHDPMVRSSFLWALRYGDADTKMQVLQALGYLADKEGEETLRRFLLQPDEDDHVKTIVILMLYDMEAEEPYRAILRGKEIDIYAKSFPRQAAWMVKWHQVKQCFRSFMENRYEAEEHQEADQIWIEFLSRSYPHVPQIRKVETWAAAVEYVVARKNNRKITQREIAERYGVSSAALASHSRKLEEVIITLARN